MAGVRAAATIASITTGTATVTLAQLLAAANQRVKVERIRISGKGTNNADSPVLIEVLNQTGAGTSSALTPVHLNTADSETAQEALQTTALQGFSSTEPTAGSIKAAFYVHPQSNYDLVFPPGRELWIRGGDRLGIRANTPVQATTFGITIEFEE